MRLIDADALIDDLMERFCKECNKRRGIKNGKYRIIYEIGEAPCRACEVDDLKVELEDAPTVDVPDRKVGEWIVIMDEPTITFDECKCSECGVVEYFNKGWKKFNYCPNCGARMFDKDTNVPDKMGESDGG